MNFKSTDLDLIAYLIAKGFKVEDKQKSGRFWEFFFDSSASKISDKWTENPTKEMLLVQKIFFEKDGLIQFIKGARERHNYDTNY